LPATVKVSVEGSKISADASSLESLAPPAIGHLRLKRPDASWSLRPWFYPLRTQRDLKTGENKILELSDNPGQHVDIRATDVESQAAAAPTTG
jgi:hypothetical protein